MIKDYKHVLQENMFDCGVACLKTIFLQFNRKIKTNDIVRNKINQGISASTLINASNKLGVDAKGIKGLINNLTKEYLPCIAHIIKDKNYFHYIVIFENDIKNNKLIVFDPSIGMQKLSYYEFNNMTTNIFITFNYKKTKKNKDNRFIKFIKKIIIKEKNIIIKSFLLSIFIIAFSLILNYFLKLVLFYSNSYKYLLIIAIIFLFITLLKNIFEYYRNKVVIYLNKRVDNKLKNNFFSHLLNLPTSYHQNKNVGELVITINDIENFKNIITKIFVLCIVDLVLLISIFIFVSYFSIYYLLIFLILVILTICLSLKYQSILDNNYLKLKTSKIKEASYLIENLKGINSIKNLNIEDEILKKEETLIKNSIDNDYLYNKSNNEYIFKNNLILEMFYILIILVVGMISINRQTDFLNIVLLSSVFSLFISFLNNINETISLYKMYQSSIDKVLDVFDEEEEEKTIKPLFIKSISFDNVTFKYDEKEILKGLNVQIEENDHILISGKSGIGKSTLMCILLKKLSDFKGKVTINNTNLKHLNSKTVREKIVYVSQEELLFNDTIINNLKLVNNDQNEIEKVKKLCLINNIYKKNNINDNYVLEENASNISGGERNKLLVARALLKKSDVIIFDESFNAIDTKEEREILTNIFNSYKNKIIILISHRLNNNDLFNKSYELKNGILQERRI